VKPLVFLGDALRRLRDFPEGARHDAGYQLHRVQCGEQPSDFKPMPEVGPGAEELRVWDASGTYRVMYVARMAQAVYVLHAFQKKTQRTARADIELARQRYREIGG